MAKAVPIYKMTLPDAPLRASAPVLLVRLQEMREFAPYIRDPKNIEELHNMRIAAKRLRYTLEIFASTLREDAYPLLKTVTDIQERLGEIHDADVLMDLLEATVEKETEREKRQSLKKKGGGPPEKIAAIGLVALLVRKREERERLYHEFLAFWDALPPDDLVRRFTDLVRASEDEPAVEIEAA